MTAASGMVGHLWRLAVLTSARIVLPSTGFCGSRPQTTMDLADAPCSGQVGVMFSIQLLAIIFCSLLCSGR